MGSATDTPLKTANSRVFIVEGRARGDHKPSYESSLRMMGVSQGYGDITRIENPDPNEYGKFIEVGEVRGATERATTSLEGRYAQSLKSTLFTLARKGCAIDVQLHIGACTDPTDFTTFDKALILEKAYLTNISTDELGALASGDNAIVNESADISAKEIWEIVPIAYGVKGGSIVTNELVDVVVCDVASCGDCEEESDGCNKIFAISLAAGGSPGTPPDVVFSVDGGVTWYAHDIETLGAAENPSGVDCVGNYLLVVSNDTNSQHYALKSEFDGATDPDFTEVATGYVTGGEPNAIFSLGSTAFIAGDGGYVYKCEDATAGVSVLDAGAAVVDDLLDVHAISEEFIVAVGKNGAVIYSDNGETFAAATTRPVGVGIDLYCVFVKSKLEWWVGTSNGHLYYTLDGGDTWTEKAFPGSGAGRVDDIEFPIESEGWLAHATATPSGRILRSYDGGYQWKVTPEKAGTLTTNDRINALAACKYDPNFVVGAGLADDGTDGFLVVGAGS